MDQPTDATTRSAEPNCAPTTSPDSAAAAPNAVSPAARKGAKILLYSPELLGLECDPVAVFGSNLAEFVQLLYDTLGEVGGVGLAAPQIGVFDQVCLIHHPDWQVVMCNPEIVEKRDRYLDHEACLSLPGCNYQGKMVHNRATVSRFETVVVRWKDVDGAECEDRFRDMPARIVQHEVDHLHGRFFIEHVKSRAARDKVLQNLANFKLRMGQR